MTPVELKLKPSFVQLCLTLGVYAIVAITNFLFSPALVSLLVLSVILFFAWRFLTRWQKPNIVAITLKDKSIAVLDNYGNSQDQAYQKPIFQSNYCVILPLEFHPDKTLVIFRDSLKTAKMSVLNRFLIGYDQP